MLEVASGVRVAAQGVAVGHGAGRVGRAVGAIGARAENHHLFQAGNIDRRSQGEFLVASP